MTEQAPQPGKTKEVLSAFTRLGFTSFGGPIAHLGYFRTEFVEKRKWLNEEDYASLVALCQFLPGPASSQVGFALGLMRAGPLGAAAAWFAFTLPSALILFLFAAGATFFEGNTASGIIHGLKIVAVAIVAHAVWGMAHNLCPDKKRATFAFLALVIVFLLSGPFGQVLAILFGGLCGYLFCRDEANQNESTMILPVSKKAGQISLGLFAFFLLGLPLISWLTPSVTIDLLDAFYRSGALVFGGGHVVLPLLEAEVVQSGWVSADQFLAGYGAAQAVPGPLFTFAAFLGGAMEQAPGGIIGATLALLMIFLPGFLLLIGVLPYWNTFQKYKNAQAIMKGTNAAVVGILGAALYQPVFTSAVLSPLDFALAFAGFLMLQLWKMPAMWVVLFLAIGGLIIFEPTLYV